MSHNPVPEGQYGTKLFVPTSRCQMCWDIAEVLANTNTYPDEVNGQELEYDQLHDHAHPPLPMLGQEELEALPERSVVIRHGMVYQRSTWCWWEPAHMQPSTAEDIAPAYLLWRGDSE